MSRLAKYFGVLALLFWGATGCYSYTPTSFETLPPGENVRLYVSRRVMLDLDSIIPMTDPSLRGKVVGRQGDQLVLRIPSGSRQIGFHSEAFDQEIPIPVSEITQAERRQFNRMATGAFIAGAAGAAAVVLFVIMDAYGEPDFPDGCTDCEDMRVPILTIPFP